MNFAICHFSVVPLRNGSSDRSEQISQLLFGELVEYLEWKGKAWVKVRCTWDNCIGWLQSRQVKPITNKEKELFEEHHAYCLDLFQPLMAGEFSMPVPIGSSLPDFDGMKFTFDNKTYFYSGQAVFPENLGASAELALKIARRYLYAPYQWGGRSPLGIDASGFTQVVYKILGLHLHREVERQVLQGTLVDFIEQALPGDLAFFENMAGNVSHTGIILPEHRIIHAGACVRIDRLDHFGIFDEELQHYTFRLRVIKRVLPPPKLPPPPVKEEIPKAIEQAVLF